MNGEHLLLVGKIEESICFLTFNLDHQVKIVVGRVIDEMVENQMQMNLNNKDGKGLDDTLICE